MFYIFVAAHMILLHSPDGAEVLVNVDEVISMRGPRSPGEDKFMTAGANCQINTSDGKFVPVKETCKEVMRIFVRTEEAP